MDPGAGYQYVRAHPVVFQARRWADYPQFGRNAKERKSELYVPRGRLFQSILFTALTAMPWQVHHAKIGHCIYCLSHPPLPSVITALLLDSLPVFLAYALHLRVSPGDHSKLYLSHLVL
jgi:hypothetical protein